MAGEPNVIHIDDPMSTRRFFHRHLLLCFHIKYMAGLHTFTRVPPEPDSEIREEEDRQVMAPQTLRVTFALNGIRYIRDLYNSLDVLRG